MLAGSSAKEGVEPALKDQLRAITCCHTFGSTPPCARYISQRRRRTYPLSLRSHNAVELQPRTSQRGKRCTSILKIAAQQVETASSFVIVPASANPGNDMQYASEAELLIGRWIFTRITPTCAPWVQEQRPGWSPVVLISQEW
jgi:hypothetical protein